MTTGETKLLFSWDGVDSLPDMRRLRLVLAAGRSGRGGVARPPGPGPGRLSGGGDVAGDGGRGGVPACLDGVVVAGAWAQSGVVVDMRIRPAAEAGQAPPGGARASANGRGRGGGVSESGALSGAQRVELLPVYGVARAGGGGHRLRDGDARCVARGAQGGVAGFRRTPRLRRQGDREPFHGAQEPRDGQDLGPGGGLGQARDTGRGQQDGQGLDEGEELVRLRLAPDRRHPLRESGGIRGDARRSPPRRNRTVSATALQAFFRPPRGRCPPPASPRPRATPASETTRCRSPSATRGGCLRRNPRAPASPAPCGGGGSADRANGRNRSPFRKSLFCSSWAIGCKPRIDKGSSHRSA